MTGIQKGLVLRICACCLALQSTLAATCTQPLRRTFYRFNDISVQPAGDTNVSWTGEVLRVCRLATRPEAAEIMSLAREDTLRHGEQRIYRATFTERVVLMGIPPVDFVLMEYCIEFEIGETP